MIDFNSIIHEARRNLKEYGNYSGIRSTMKATNEVRSFISDIIKKYSIKSINDIGCGDFSWMKYVPLFNVNYVGFDFLNLNITEALKYSSNNINFIKCNIFEYDIPPADLVICRDIISYLSLKRGMGCINCFRDNRSKYLLADSYPDIEENKDLEDDSISNWRKINLELSPYNLGKPIEITKENHPSCLNRVVGLWELKPRYNKRGIWSGENFKRGEGYWFDESLSEAITKLYKPNSVVDLGCGKGVYCKYFYDFGWNNTIGYEGTYAAAKKGVYNNIKVADLSRKQSLPKSDLVICLEVGEHIHKKFEQIFINNVVRSVGKHLIISWAIEGQGGTGHVNERNNDYIYEQFVKKRGMYYNRKNTKFLRENAKLSWFKKSLMVFDREKNV